MKISVIVPVYNGGNVLGRCLDSLLAQTFRELEILVVNDGSRDATRKIAEEYQRKNKKIRVINKENEGAAQARKTGVEYALGEYIGFLDADDWAEPVMFEALYNACVRNEALSAACSFWWDYGKKRVGGAVKQKEELLTGKEALQKLNTREKIYPYVWNKLFHKDLFCSVRFPSGNFVGEDYMIVTQLLCGISKIVWLPEPYYHYVQSENSVCRGGFSESYKTAYENYERCCLWLSGRYPDMQVCFENYFLTESLSFLAAMARNDHYDREMIYGITAYAKMHKRQYIKADYLDCKYKISICAVCINYRILTVGYKILARLKKFVR